MWVCKVLLDTQDPKAISDTPALLVSLVPKVWLDMLDPLDLKVLSGSLVRRAIRVLWVLLGRKEFKAILVSLALLVTRVQRETKETWVSLALKVFKVISGTQALLVTQAPRETKVLWALLDLEVL
jgi:hypothetical protein